MYNKELDVDYGTVGTQDNITVELKRYNGAQVKAVVWLATGYGKPQRLRLSLADCMALEPLLSRARAAIEDYNTKL